MNTKRQKPQIIPLVIAGLTLLTLVFPWLSFPGKSVIGLKLFGFSTFDEILLVIGFLAVLAQGLLAIGRKKPSFYFAVITLASFILFLIPFSESGLRKLEYGAFGMWAAVVFAAMMVSMTVKVKKK